LTRTDIRTNPRSEKLITTKEKPGISIIIPCKTIDAYTKECIDHCLKMEYSNYEILVLPDYCDNSETADELMRVIPTGSMKPMPKRLIAASMSNSTFCAFIDSDAFPTKNWLRNAIRHFKDPQVAAVVGPSLTPDDDSLLAKASGFVLASPLGGGSESIRYSRSHSHIRYVSEAPTCNFIIRKSVLNVGKDLLPDVWPGEEIALCGVVTKDLQKKIVYDPQVAVYHHRRKLFISHLKQVWQYGAVKGYLLKKHSQYIRSIFFLPSLLVLGIVGGFPLAILDPVIGNAYVLLLLAYFLLSLGNGIFTGLREKSIKVVLLILAGTIMTHLCYGLAFIRGLFSRKL
jgi:glycosyltransferase involved in cell wall biosynthesis